MTNQLDYSLPWINNNFVVLDLEGTGPQHKEREGIVEIAAIQICGKEITSKFFYKLINPEIEIPSVVSRIHGLKNSDLEHEPTFNVIKSELLDFIDNKILIGHNVMIDYRLLKIKMPEYNPSLVLDTQKLSKHFPDVNFRHNLDALIERFQIQDMLIDLPIKRSRHSAYYDSYATGVVFLKILEKHLPVNASLKDVMDICGVSVTSPIDNQTTLF